MMMDDKEMEKTKMLTNKERNLRALIQMTAWDAVSWPKSKEIFNDKDDLIIFFLTTPEQKAFYKQIANWFERNIERLKKDKQMVEEIMYEHGVQVTTIGWKNSAPIVWCNPYARFLELSIVDQTEALGEIKRMLKEYGKYNDKDNILQNMYHGLYLMDAECTEDYNKVVEVKKDDKGHEAKITKGMKVTFLRDHIEEFINGNLDVLHRDMIDKDLI